MGKLEKETERFFDKVVDKKVVNKKLSIKNLLTLETTEEENQRLKNEVVIERF